MSTVRGLLIVCLLGTASLALAQPGGSKPGPAAKPAIPPPPKPNVPEVVSATEVVKLTPPAGFIDDVVDGDAQRLAYVIADTAGRAELHVYTYATKMEHVVDLAPHTPRPVAITLWGPTRAFVVSKNEDGTHSAALVELADNGKAKAGAAVYKVGPAADITVIKRDGKQRIAVHKVSPGKAGTTKHEVELLAIETGKRAALAKPLELDAQGQHAKLELKVNHWTDGFTRAHGIKAGAWNRKENERDPDSEASYDLVTGKFYDVKKIDNLMEQRKRFQVLAETRRTDFVRMTWDNSNIELWAAGKPKTVTLDLPLGSYDPKSLQGVVAADGSAWIALQIDPVNADAVARKKADVEYFDIFRVGADGKGTRKARVLSHRVQQRFGVIGDRFWVSERLNGFDRGGRHVAVYQPQ